MDARSRELKKQFKQAEILEARTRLPLSEAQLRALLQALESSAADTDCDHTARHTIDWLTAQNLPVDAVGAALQAFGGFCDCEVLANVRPSLFGWRD